MLQLYGLHNCDTTKKARAWLGKNDKAFKLHDLRDEPPTETLLKDWCNQVGWEKILNKPSTTWRGLSATDQEALKDAETAVALLLQHPTLIKRPVITDGNNRIKAIGFKEKELAAQLG